MKLGIERNKVIMLIAAWAVLIVTVYFQFFASDASVRVRPPAPAAASRTPAPAAAPSDSRPPAQRQAFRPRFSERGSDEPLDPMTVDPTLRTDLLAKVQEVEFTGVERNLFLYGQRKNVVPPPSQKEIELAQKRLEEARKRRAAQPKPAKPPESKAPPIQLKYYGFASEAGIRQRRAFLLDGDEVLIGGEGDIFKQRYKIIRIGISSIIMEDLEYKDQQTIRIVEQPS